MKEKYLALASLSLATLGLTAFGPAPSPAPEPTSTPTSTPTPKPTSTPTPNPTPSFSPAPPVDSSGLNSTYSALAAKVAIGAPQVPQVALKRALLYLQSNSGSIANKDYVTVVDFTLASTKKRMYVIKTSNGSVESFFSAHAKNSGDNYATKFSNTDGSLMSSVGIYVTGGEYQGDNGRSMRLNGKESTNSNAYSRAIVLHGADYVSQDFIDQNGRLGRSWGCPAVELRYRDELVSELEGGSVFYIYHSSFCTSTSCHN